MLVPQAQEDDLVEFVLTGRDEAARAVILAAARGLYVGCPLAQSGVPWERSTAQARAAMAHMGALAFDGLVAAGFHMHRLQ